MDQYILVVMRIRHPDPHSDVPGGGLSSEVISPANRWRSFVIRGATSSSGRSIA